MARTVTPEMQTMEALADYRKFEHKGFLKIGVMNGKKVLLYKERMSKWDRFLSFLGISGYNTKKVLPLAEKAVCQLEGVKKQQVLSSLLGLEKQDCNRKIKKKQLNCIIKLVRTKGESKVPTTYEEAKLLLRGEIREQKAKQVPFRDYQPAYAYMTTQLKDAVDFNPLSTTAGADLTLSFLKGLAKQLQDSKNLPKIKKIAQDLSPCAEAFKGKSESELSLDKRVVLNIFFLRCISPLCKGATNIIAPVQKIINDYCFPKAGRLPIPEDIKKVLDELASLLVT